MTKSCHRTSIHELNPKPDTIPSDKENQNKLHTHTQSNKHFKRTSALSYNKPDLLEIPKKNAENRRTRSKAELTIKPCYSRLMEGSAQSASLENNKVVGDK